MGLKNTRLLARAIHGRWPVPDELKSQVMKELADVYKDPEAGPREKIASSRAIMAADQLNIEREKMSQADEHHGDQLNQQQLDRLAAIASRHGFGEIARIASEGGSRVISSTYDASFEATEQKGSRTRSGRKTQARKTKRGGKDRNS